MTWVCVDFTRKNSRYFTREEKRRVVLGMLAIDMALHALGTWFYVGFTGKQYVAAEARRNRNNG